MFDVELLNEAEEELPKAYDWYEDKQTGLGNRLFREVPVPNGP